MSSVVLREPAPEPKGATDVRAPSLLHRVGALLADLLSIGTRPVPPSDSKPVSSARTFAGPTRELRATTSRVTLLLLALNDLPYVHARFGKRAAGKIAHAAAETLRTLAGKRGRVYRTAPTIFTAVLPGVTPQSAVATLKGFFGGGTSFDVQVGHEELVVPASFAATELAREASLEEAYLKLCGKVLGPGTKRSMRGAATRPSEIDYHAVPATVRMPLE